VLVQAFCEDEQYVVSMAMADWHEEVPVLLFANEAKQEGRSRSCVMLQEPGERIIAIIESSHIIIHRPT